MIRQPVTWILSLILSFATLSAMAADEHAEHGEHHMDKKVMAQTNCPIRGGEIDKEVFVDYKGKRVYFCCPGCDREFLANADALIKDMEAKGITLATAPTAQTICPVSDEEIDKDVFVEYNGQKVFLCCKMCRGKFNKDPETYMKKLAAQQAATNKKAMTDEKHHEGSHSAN